MNFAVAFLKKFTQFLNVQEIFKTVERFKDLGILQN